MDLLADAYSFHPLRSTCPERHNTRHGTVPKQGWAWQWQSQWLAYYFGYKWVILNLIVKIFRDCFGWPGQASLFDLMQPQYIRHFRSTDLHPAPEACRLVVSVCVTSSSLWKEQPYNRTSHSLLAYLKITHNMKNVSVIVDVSEPISARSADLVDHRSIPGRALHWQQQRRRRRGRKEEVKKQGKGSYRQQLGNADQAG